MTRYDLKSILAMIVVALLFVFLIAQVPGALHDHSCATLEPGQVEGC